MPSYFDEHPLMELRGGKEKFNERFERRGRGCDRCVEGIQGTHTALKAPDWPEAPPGHAIV